MFVHSKNKYIINSLHFVSFFDIIITVVKCFSISTCPPLPFPSTIPPITLLYSRLTVLIHNKACLMRLKLALCRNEDINRYSVYESFLLVLWSFPVKMFSHRTLVVMQKSHSMISSLDGNRSEGFNQSEGAHRNNCITLAVTSGLNRCKELVRD